MPPQVLNRSMTAVCCIEDVHFRANRRCLHPAIRRCGRVKPLALAQQEAVKPGV